MSKSIWRILFVCALCLCLWRCGTAAVHTWRYWHLNTLIPVKVEKWDVEQVGWSEYAIIAHYSYEFSGKRYENKIKFDKPYHLNLFAAQDEIKTLSKKAWKGWIDAKNPQFSSLQKSFPFLSVFYAVVILGIMIYFFSIYFYKNKEEF